MEDMKFSAVHFFLKEFLFQRMFRIYVNYPVTNRDINFMGRGSS